MFDEFVHQQYWIMAAMFVLIIVVGTAAPLLITFRQMGLDPISRAQARRRQQDGPHQTGRL
jgi:hypothetical protein